MAVKNKPTRFQIIRTLVWLVGVPIVLLALAGDWFWTEGWIFIAWFLCVTLTIFAYLRRRDPELLAERLNPQSGPGQARWDRFIMPLMQALFLIWIVIMPLDAHRYHWSPLFPVWLEAVGGLALALSFYFMFGAFADNTYASPLIKVQPERHQQVVSTGVYSIVRHPMYLGGILLNLGTPLLLGSAYGLIIGGLVTLLLAVRILGEEKMLAARLDGYDEYCRKVKYRLIPFVW
jgi:protein-S-isoprenylcysteine O-methyltransferase Ste14